MKLFFIFSVILNIVLLSIVFFKSALNEILLDLFKSHRQKQEKLLTGLLDLHSLMFEYNDIVYQIITTLSKNSKNIDAEENMKEYLERSGKLNKKFVSLAIFKEIVDKKTLEKFQNSLIGYRDLLSNIVSGKVSSAEEIDKKSREIWLSILEIMVYIEERIAKLNKRII